MKSSSANGVIHGYSERGVVNALFESLVAANDKALFQEFMDLMVHWREGSKRDPVPEFDSYEVYIEPSLSDFGEPDVLIFLKEKDKKEKDKDVGVYFIEAKVEPFLHSSPPVEKKGEDFYKQNASSVLHQLFLKVSLVKALRRSAKWIPRDLVGGVENVYADDKKALRKIGNDPLVLELARRLHRFVRTVGEPYYVSLTTDCGVSQGEEVVTLASDIVNLNVIPNQLKIYEALDQTFQERLLLLSWQRIFRFVASHKCLARACHQLERNAPKFLFPPVKDKVAADGLGEILCKVVDHFVPDASGDSEETDKPGRKTWFSIPKNGRFKAHLGDPALFTVSVSHGLDGPLLGLYTAQTEVREALHKKEETRLLQQMWSDKLWVRVSELEATNRIDESASSIREIRKVVEEHLRFLKNIRASKEKKQ